MEIHGKTFSSITTKVGIAIQPLKDNEPIALNIYPNGYYLASSFGKDSMVITGTAIKIAISKKDSIYYVTLI